MPFKHQEHKCILVIAIYYSAVSCHLPNQLLLLFLNLFSMTQKSKSSNS